MAEVDEDEEFDRDTESVAFPKLDDRQLALLEPLGARRILRRGELVFKAGQRDMPMAVVLRGAAEESEILEVPALQLRQALAQLPRGERTHRPRV